MLYDRQTRHDYTKAEIDKGYMTVIARPPIVVEGMLDRVIQRKELDSPVERLCGNDLGM
jgi:hypothetical protein